MESPHITQADVTLEQLAQALQLGNSADVWRSEWDESGRSFDPARLWVLDPEHLAQACSAIGLDAAIAGELERARGQLLQQPLLMRLLWHCHHELHGPGISPTTHMVNAWSWPALPKLPGLADAVNRLFYVLTYLNGYPDLLRLHQQRRISPAMTKATLSDLQLHIGAYREKHGHIGFASQGWLSHHFTGRLYSFGRLQLEITRFHLPYRVFRRLGGSDVAALVAGGRLFRGDGQFASAGLEQGAATWTSQLEQSAAGVRGHVVLPDCSVAREPRLLSLPPWQLALQENDPVFSVHIPASGPMLDEACCQSYRQGLAFFPQHFPDWPVRAFMCISWLMDVQLALYMPPEANIVRFLRRFHPLPIEGAHDRQHFERVFGGPAPDLDQAPQATQLQRAMIAHVRAGKQWRQAAGFFFPDELDAPPAR